MCSILPLDILGVQFGLQEFAFRRVCYAGRCLLHGLMLARHNGLLWRVSAASWSFGPWVRLLCFRFDCCVVVTGNPACAFNAGAGTAPVVVAAVLLDTLAATFSWQSP